MSVTSLVKTQLHNSIADSVYKEVTNRTEKYYYFLGSVLEWVDPLNPPIPSDSLNYEREARQNIVFVKEIQPGDISYIVNRINWESGTVYDMFDDDYSDRLVGIDLKAGGGNYSGNTSITISGGGGSGATANLTIVDGVITGVNLLTRGQGYTTAPNVTISDSFGTGAVANSVVNYAYSGATKLEDSNFYVITDDFNIYKCLDNFNNTPSTVKPVDTTFEPIVTSDGYKWKYMGNIPLSLRNKYLTSTQVPVVTSLNNQFYSSGEIKNITVDNTGDNYTWARVVVQGDGNSSDDPLIIINSNVVSGGSGYTYATVSIEPPISNVPYWVANTAYTVGKIFIYKNNFYEVVRAGTTGTYGPIHTRDIQTNGTVGLKFRATQVTGNLSISGGNVTGFSDLNGDVREIAITNGGSGYLSAPLVNISGGDGANAKAISTITNNTVTKITVIDSGTNYNIIPNVVIGSQWAANTAYTLNNQVFYNTKLYTVTTAGYSNTLAPTQTTGSITSGNAVFSFAGIKATANAVLRYGAGYTFNPNVSISGDGAGAIIKLESEKTSARLHPYVSDGKITDVIVEDGGTGYTYATTTIEGDGGNAKIRVDLSPGDLNSLQATNELLAVDGAIHAIKLISQGYNYTTANVNISGDGSGATANATILNGKIIKINIITEGSGYTTATANISGNGKGATCRVILPPKGGHGKDTVSELYARKLGFYSTISQELNHGLAVDNEYRQFGILKNIKNYNGSSFYNKSVGSGCWFISATVNTTIFKKDVTITRSSDNARFLIISSSANGLLVIALDGKPPVDSDILLSPSGAGVSVTGITEPDIDKYSGDLLYINNYQAFTTTEEQSVAIKSIFTF